MQKFKRWLQNFKNNIHINMEFEDSRNALFVEPNAYIQRCQKQTKTPTKVVFQEPYDCLPNYYFDNGFKKKDCECIPKQENNKKKEQHTLQNVGFDFKNLMPMLSSFLGGSNLGGILSMLGGTDGGLDLSKLMSGLMQNGNGFSSILNMFKGNKQNDSSGIKNPKQTDFEIKKYTKV